MWVCVPSHSSPYPTAATTDCLPRPRGHDLLNRRRPAGVLSCERVVTPAHRLGGVPGLKRLRDVVHEPLVVLRAVVLLDRVLLRRRIPDRPAVLPRSRPVLVQHVAGVLLG